MNLNKLYIAKTLFFMFLFSLAQCSSETNFQSAAKKQKLKSVEKIKDSGDAKPEIEEDEEPELEEKDVPEEVSPVCDMSGDFIELGFPKHIQKCIDQGQIYDFGSESCSPISKETNFSCTFRGLELALEGINIPPEDILQKANEKDGKLVACGQKNHGQTIVAQWWYPNSSQLNQKSCEYSGKMIIVTACYAGYKSGLSLTGTASTSGEDATAKVRQCLQLQ